jgi:AcrR family transcriptional regulator
MPRSYRLGQRQQIIEQTRARIVAAARELLITAPTLTDFSFDAIARQADVSRMTVYHQFGTKLGLLEAVCDTLAANGGMEHLATAFRAEHLPEALDIFVRTFCQFWSADRAVIRRLNAYAVFDPDFGRVMQTRNERRRHGLRVLLERHRSDLSPQAREEVIGILFTLTSYECADMLAGPSGDPQAIAPQIIHLVHLLLNQPPHGDI